MGTISRTEDLKTAINSILEPIHPKVYYLKAPKGIQYPYVTYILEHKKEDNRYDYDFEVHVWTRDIKAVEHIADLVEKEFDKNTYTDNVQSFDLDLDTRINVPDEDKELNHIRLLFNLSYYHKEG